ncbi:(2Fe-2S)-binding protein [Novosphingobium sp. AAP83]|uniref:Rieske (2Fe-2S) protein n=1 Tax=Novosphingobium sp. AAP83 TaxID=1523425 RepID=UPI0006B88FF5|nr:Rieske 2Fe-2S domain-containing protein [Novosphingobium sp. AAP83]KPF91861.1 (2Fe-2S)-binding protein [Novosphingobium sp. AAP83]
MSDFSFTPVLPLADLAEGTAVPVAPRGEAVLLCMDEGVVYAIENRCSHLSESLASGKIKWGCIACPIHGARFDLATGEALSGPAKKTIRSFAVRIRDGMIEIASNI